MLDWLFPDLYIDDTSFSPYVSISLLEDVIHVSKQSSCQLPKFDYKKSLDYDTEVSKMINSYDGECPKKQFILDVPRMNFVIDGLCIKNPLMLLNYLYNDEFCETILLFCNQSIMASVMEIFNNTYYDFYFGESKKHLDIYVKNGIINAQKLLHIINLDLVPVNSVIFHVYIDIVKKQYIVKWKMCKFTG